MIKTRQSVIERKKAMKRLDSSKKLIIRINTGLVLFSASAVLNQLTPETQSTTVYAQSNRLSPSEFLKNISGYAKDIAAKNDLYASVMIAQAALESAWGNSTLAQSPNYNLFGIKGDYNGNSIHVETLEDDGSGNYYTITDDFRKYEDYDQSLGDYASLLTGDNDPSSWRYEFYSGARYSNTDSYQDATQYLTGRYATDTSYATKLNKIIEQYGLAEFDMNGNPVEPETPVEEVPANPEVPETPSTPDVPSTSVGSYTVKAGDSLYRIAANHGITLTQLMEANSLTSYFIAPNQKLAIPGGTTDNEAGNSASEESTKPEVDNSVTTEPSSPAAGGSYAVKAGDSYWAIASKYGISITELQKLNGTTSFLIHPGQSLKVPGTESSTTPETIVPEATTPGNVENGTVTTPSTSGSYSVKSGDSLYAIASKHGMTLSQLRELNNLSGSLIYPGQSLKVSGATTTPSAPEVNTPETSVPTTPSTPETSTPVTGSGSYTVQRGDSLYAIATKHGMSLSQLQSLNGLSGYLIHPGQVLSVSGTAAVQASVETVVESLEVAPEVEVAPAEIVVETLEVAPEVEVTPAEIVVETLEVTPEIEVTTPVETVLVESASTVGTHVVQAGETLYTIAQKHGLDVYKLIAINGGNNILVGQVINLN